MNQNLLNYTDAVRMGREGEFRARYREIACRWLRFNRPVWMEWTRGWNKKKELLIGGLFTFTGKNELTELASSEFFFELSKSSKFFLALTWQSLALLALCLILGK